MTTFPELMEILSEVACKEMYNAVSDWHRQKRDEREQWNNLYIDFIENDIYCLWRDEMPKPDEQGGYEYEELVRFTLSFRDKYLNFGERRDKIS